MTAAAAKLVGSTIVGDNGSMAVVTRAAWNLRDHAHVRIVDAKGHHKTGDNLVWAIPETLLAELNKAKSK